LYIQAFLILKYGLIGEKKEKKTMEPT